MSLFSIFEPRELRPGMDPAPRAVPDRFSWFAALLPPVFMLVHALWLPLFGWLVALIVLGFAGSWIGLEAASLVYVLLSILIGFEASALRRRGLRRRGLYHAGELIAPAADQAQVVWLQRREAQS